LKSLNERRLRGKPSHYGDNETHHLPNLVNHEALTFDLLATKEQSYLKDSVEKVHEITQKITQKNVCLKHFPQF
jgi:hypothetical protein